jgi:hypothetical protein
MSCKLHNVEFSIYSKLILCIYIYTSIIIFTIKNIFFVPITHNAKATATVNMAPISNPAQTDLSMVDTVGIFSGLSGELFRSQNLFHQHSFYANLHPYHISFLICLLHFLVMSFHVSEK